MSATSVPTLPNTPSEHYIQPNKREKKTITNAACFHCPDGATLCAGSQITILRWLQYPVSRIRFSNPVRKRFENAMLLIVEIATVVLAGMLLYRSLIWYTTTINYTLPYSIESLLFWVVTLALAIVTLGDVGFGFYVLASHPQYLTPHRVAVLVGAGLSLIFVLTCTIYYDRVARKKVNLLASKAVCIGCGKLGLKFDRFKDGANANWGEEHDHPMGICPKCGQKQELSVSA